MTAAFLQSELTNLISDSKRKNVDVRTAAEKSLADLKSISVTSETQLAGDLIRKSQFIDPFILACKSQNTKLASNGAACLQRLVASTAIPRFRLPDLLQAFEEAVPLALEVQLKILQTLPSLLQLYAADLHGEALSRTLSVSADLSSNKLPMVSSTASATFQQLLTSVFTKATTTTSQNTSSSEKESAQDSEDAVAIFKDLCALLSGSQLEYVRLDKLQPPLILETVESLLSTYGSFILGEDDALKACANSLIPGLSTLIENSASYPVVVRAFRITFILTIRYMSQLAKPLGGLLKVLLKVVDRGGNHTWKRILSLEFCRGFCSDFDAFRRSFALFDMVDGMSNLVADLMASLVRIASEDPTLIGLGRQSTIPTSSSAENTSDIARAIETPTAVGSVAQAEQSSVGISAQGSSIPTPCLDQYDRSSAPEIPETYIFTLVLGCTSAFSDGLSKFIMPLSVPNRKSSVIFSAEQDESADNQPQRQGSLRSSATSSKYQQLTNPLTRKDFSGLSSVQECARMIESCWPAVLATCSTFLNAALDSYFYHILIRTVQKLAQVSGVLELNTPRDALLTTLAKVSVPANVSSLMNSFYGTKPAYRADSESLQNGEEPIAQTPISATPRQSIDISPQSLNVRNLLCLRALLNLGIALGPTLSGSAWKIVWQSLEQVEALMAVNPTNKMTQGSGSSVAGETSATSTLASEISAVDTARRRMVESTTAYSDSAFEIACKSLFDMIEDVIPTQDQPQKNAVAPSETLRPNAPSHKSTRSVSGSWTKVATLEIEVQFVLKFVGRLASVNLQRFKQADSSAVSWDCIVATLSFLQSNRRLQSHLRLQCANIIDAIVVESCSVGSDEDAAVEYGNDLIIQKYSIPALQKQIENVQYDAGVLQKSSQIEVQTILLMLEALHNLISSCGEGLGKGWNGVFAILNAVTSHSDLAAEGDPTESRSQTEGLTKLYSAAFKVVLLIASDFLPNLDSESLVELLTLLAIFGHQKYDLNMSLTTIALYWNVAGLIDDPAAFVKPFNKESNASDLMSGEVSSLWQATILSLKNHCKDSRNDSRNAAVRMLAKIVETSMPQMSPDTLNSYYTVVSLPLLDFYTQDGSSTDSSRNDTAIKVLQDLVAATQLHGPLLLKSKSFHETWQSLLMTTGNLLRVRDATMIATACNALADIVYSLSQSEASASFVVDKTLLEQTWTLWITNDPTILGMEGHTQHAYAGYARFLSAIAHWNLSNLFAIANAADRMADAIKKIIYNSSHEAYTVDVSRMSVEQEQVVRLLDVLKELSTGQYYRPYVLLLLSLADEMTTRTALIHYESTGQNSRKGTRQPTGIAFVTACIENLRSLLRSETISTDVLANCPFDYILATCTCLIKTKYSNLPTNIKEPLWQRATLLAVESVEIVNAYSKHHLQDLKLDKLVSAMNTVTTAILEVPHLKLTAAEARPSADMIASDEVFDGSQINRLHVVMHNFLRYNSATISKPYLKQYILILFHNSLATQPWYNDLPPDLEHKPLSTINKIRPGSIRDPILPIRPNIYSDALRCLLDLVTPPKPMAPSSNETNNHRNDSNSRNENESVLSTLAAPYILLRLAHTIKTFLADQPLRYLQHPHLILQKELHTILRSFVDLRVSDDAFIPTTQELNLNLNNTVRNDGKTHLRIMAGLARKFEETWRRLPRLKRGMAWQDYEDGVGIERCLAEWREALVEGSTVQFE